MLLSALGIIMVVDAHAWSPVNLFANFIPYNSFFMPMFVFISGYFNKVDKDTSLPEYCKRKVKRLLLPYFTFSIVFLLISSIILFIKTPDLNIFLKCPLSLLFAFTSGEIVPMCSPLWFIPMLFFTELTYAFVKKYFCAEGGANNEYLLLVIFVCLNIFVVFFAKNGFVNSLNLLASKVIFFLVFIQLGVLYRKKIEQWHNEVNKLVLLLILLLVNMSRIMIMPRAYDIAFNNLSTLSGFTSPYYVTPLISSIIGIAFWLTIVNLIGPALYENKTINYISNNTYWIMGTHVSMFVVLNNILKVINKFFVELPNLNPSQCLYNPWYRWEYFPSFRLLYFTFGIVGAVLTKKLFDLFLRKYSA